MLKIEKGVAFQAGIAGREKSISSEVPWGDLQVGDSVLVPRDICDQYADARATLHAAAKTNGISIMVRSAPEGIRIWRKA